MGTEAGGMSGQVDRRERGPWKPERGQLVRLWPATLAVPEWAAFTLAMIIAAALLIIAVVLF